MHNILMETLRKKTYHMQVFKHLFILSFLLICSINQDDLPIFVYLLLSFIEFFNSFTYHNIGISWELGLMPVLVIGTLIIFCSYNKFRNVYLMILCLISLLIFIISETGILNVTSYSRISFQFVIPLSVFIISSIILIVKIFINTTEN